MDISSISFYEFFYIAFLIAACVKIIQVYSSKKSVKIFLCLLVYHLVITVIYYLNLMNNGNGDPFVYYKFAQRADDWLSTFGYKRRFLIFINYPFIHYLKSSILTVSFFYSLLGFLGIFFATRNLLNQIGFKFGLVLLLFLPSLHFWSSSLSKESLLIFALGILINEFYREKPNVIVVAICLFIAMMTRTYMGAVFGASVGLSILVFNRSLTFRKKLPVLLVAGLFTCLSVAFFAKVLKLDTNSERVIEEIEKRQKNWTRADSTYDISNYNKLERASNFLFRPLFYDIGKSRNRLIASFENLVLLILTIHLIFMAITRENRRFASGLIQFNAAYFFFTLFVLSTVTANLGTAMRKKSTILPSFIILYGVFVYRGKDNQDLKRRFFKKS